MNPLLLATSLGLLIGSYVSAISRPFALLLAEPSRAVPVTAGLALLGLGLGWISLGRRNGRSGGEAGVLILIAAFASVAGPAAAETQVGVHNMFSPDFQLLEIRSSLSFWHSSALAALAVLPLAFALGALLPSRSKTAAWLAGLAGGLLGWFASNHFLIPAAGSRNALILPTAALFAGALSWNRNAWQGRPRRYVQLSLGAVFLLSFLFWLPTVPSSYLSYLQETASGSLSVLRDKEGRAYFFSDGILLRTSDRLETAGKAFLAGVPALVHGRPEKALVLGMEDGCVAGLVSLLPSIEKVVVADPTPGIAEALEAVSQQNRLSEWRQGKVALVPSAAPVFLVSGSERFHLILYNLPPPPVEPAPLRKILALAKPRLAEGAEGLLALSLPVSRRSPAEIGRSLRELRQAFPRREAWLSGDHLILLGAEAFPALDGETLGECFALEPVQRSFRRIGISSPPELLAFYLGDGAFLDELADRLPEAEDRPGPSGYGPPPRVEKPLPEEFYRALLAASPFRKPRVDLSGQGGAAEVERRRDRLLRGIETGLSILGNKPLAPQDYFFARGEFEEGFLFEPLH